MRRNLLQIRDSSIHGKGAYAACRIGRGTDVVEYTGERIEEPEADRRYDEALGAPERLVLLFQVDGGLVIDAGVGGNDARFVNHSCAPNCESVLVEGRVFIRAIRDIRPGEELTYDYKLTHEEGDGPQTSSRFPCRCGTPSCRGTLLARRRSSRRSRRPAETRR